MTPTQKTKALRNNTLLWLAAMLLPAVFHFTLAGTKFPWPVILPLLLVGAMLASNSMLSRAVGAKATEESSR